MKKIKWWILGGVLLCILGYFIYIGVDSHWQKYNELQGKNNILKKQNVELQEKLKVLDLKKDSISVVLDSLQTEIDGLKTQRPLIQKERQISRARLNKMPNSAWQKWYDNKVAQLKKKYK